MLRRLFTRELTDDQKTEFVASLQKDFEGEDLSDATLRRFCTAREWDQKATADMLKEHLTWRKTTLPIQRSAAIDRVLESGRVRVLRRGETPVICIDFMWGQFLTEEFTVDNIIDANIWVLEDLLAEADAARADGQPSQYIAVSTGGPPTKELVKKISPIFDINYPERCATAIIYPIPRWMKFVAEALLLLVPKRTREKFVLFSEEAEFCAKTGLSAAELPEDLKGGIEAGKARRDQALADKKRRAQMPKEFIDAMETPEGSTQVLMSQVSC